MAPSAPGPGAPRPSSLPKPATQLAGQRSNVPTAAQPSKMLVKAVKTCVLRILVILGFKMIQIIMFVHLRLNILTQKLAEY